MAVTGPYSNANYNQNALNFFAQNNGVDPSQVTYVPGVGYQVLGQTNNAASQFQPTYQQGQQATGGGVNPSPLNPVDYASPQTAQQLAGLLGGKVAPDTAMGTGQGASVNIPTPNGIQLPNGQMVDAGTIANLFQRGYSPEALAQQLQSQSGGAISGITPQQIAQFEGAPAPGAAPMTAAQAATGAAPPAGARGTRGADAFGMPLGAQGARLANGAAPQNLTNPTMGGNSPYASANVPAAWNPNSMGVGGAYAGQGASGNPFQIGNGVNGNAGVPANTGGSPALQPRDTSTGGAAGNTSILADILGFFGIGQGANALQQAAYAGEQGTLGAAKTGTQIITDTLNRNSNALGAAQNSAINDVGQYGNFAHNLLSGNLSASMANDYPFINQGQQGVNALGNYAANLPQFGMSPYALNASPTGGSSPNIPGVAPDPRAVLPGGAGAAGGGPPQFSFNPTAYQLAQTPGYQFALQQGENAIQNQSSAGGGGIGSNQDLTAAKYATGLAGQQYEQAFQNAAQGFGLNQQAYNQAYQNSLQGFQANQGLNLQALGMLQNAGLQGVGQENQALQAFGLPAAQYLYNTGLFGGNAIENTALANAQQGLQGMQYEAGMLLPAAEQAGAFALEGAGANAAGIIGQNNNLAGIGQSLGGLALGFLGL